MEGEREGGGERERHQAQNVLLIRVSNQRSLEILAVLDSPAIAHQPYDS